MPFGGNAARRGAGQQTSSIAVHNESLTLGNGATGSTQPLQTVGLPWVSVLVQQTAGAAPGASFRLEGQNQGNTPTIVFPFIPIGALLMPVQDTRHAAMRAIRATVVAPPAGEPHTFGIAYWASI